MAGAYRAGLVPSDAAGLCSLEALLISYEAVSLFWVTWLELEQTLIVVTGLSGNTVGYFGLMQRSPCVKIAVIT